MAESRNLCNHNIANEVQTENFTGKILTSISGAAKQAFESRGTSRVFNDFVDMTKQAKKLEKYLDDKYKQTERKQS